MISVLSVTSEQIQSIKAPQQLVELLRRLLHAEARVHGIARRGVTVPPQITVADGGEDGRIEWQNGPETTNFLPARLVMFQSKATGMPPGKCKQEAKKKDGSLKDAIKQVLDAKGAYIIFSTDKAISTKFRKRVAAIREGIAEASGNAYPNASVDFYNANKIAEWVNIHPPVASWALATFFNRSVEWAQSWESWSKNPELKAQAYTFVPGKSVDGLLDLGKVLSQVPAHLASPRSVARIVGLSGLGKTRVALEMFRPIAADPVKNAESVSVLYTTAQHGRENVLRLVRDLHAEHLDAIVVVDECDIELHSTLAKMVEHPDTKCSLLTLDYDPAAVGEAPHFIELRRLDDKTIKGILKQAYPSLKDPEIGRICEFAQGFPHMAVLLGGASLSEESQVVTLKDDLVLQRLVWGRGPKDPNGHKVLEACSLFATLGVDGPAKEELEFLATSICNIPWQECFEWIVRFEKRQLIQRRGDYIQVLPKPLALRLAGERWSTVHPDEAKAWFTGAMPERMRTTLCDQIARLDFLPTAKQLVDHLCGPSGPFSNPEVLTTKTGSRCFRSLVETNSEATMLALERAFGSSTTEELLGVSDGRRSLIWALEKLCFRKETFHRAARLLLGFAAAENETWGNNATGQFIHLFQLVLSGTEANGDQKFAFLDEALRSTDPRYLRILVDALDRGLMTSGFTRTLGAEQQGSGKPLEDWRPSQAEAVGYLRKSLSRLTAIAIAIGDSAIAGNAKNKIAGNIRGLVNAGLLSEVTEAIDAVIKKHGAYWAEAIDGVADVLQYDSERISKELLAKVRALHDRLLPQSLDDRLKFYVTELPWDFTYGEKKDEVERIIGGLAEECAKNPEFTFGKIPEWLTGSHRQFYAFGHKLGEIFPDAPQFVRRALDHLKNGTEDTNAAVLGAFLAGAQKDQPELVTGTLRAVAAEPALQKFLIDLTRLLPIGSEEIARIIPLVRSGNINTAHVRLLAYGSVLTALSPEELDPLLEALQERGAEGVWVALDIVSMYLHGRAKQMTALHTRIASLLSADGLLSQDTTSISDDHHFEVLAQLLLDDEQLGEGLARHLASEIVAVCKLKRFPYNRDHLITKLMEKLFAKHVRSAWPAFREAISEKNPLTDFHLEHVLGPGFDKGEGRKGVLLAYSEDELIAWCTESPDVAPAFLSKVASLLPPDGQTFSSLILRIVDLFGTRKDVLRAISHNMHSFSSVGSLVPYYARWLKPLEGLLTHQHGEVRKFARNEIESIKASIAQETKRDQEQDFGIF